VASVYSTKLICVQGMSGISVYTNTPSLNVAVIVRDLDVYSAGIAGVNTFAMLGPTGNVIFYWTWAAGLKQSAMWRGRQVLNPGDTLTVEGGGVDVMVSGYSLSLP
jgi:hypothetical protein